MIPKEYHIIFTLTVIALSVITLVVDRFKASMVFLVALATLLLGGVLSTSTVLEGLTNTSILTIFLLIIITAAVNEHFSLGLVLDKIFGKTKTAGGFILKMSLGVASISAFMNNTPVVAVMMPYVHQWGKRHNINPSKLLMPLSFAAIAGGMITLIGTSTNLVLNGLLIGSEVEPLGFFDFFIPGVLITLSIALLLTLVAPILLNNNKDLLEIFKENKREYLIETRLTPQGMAVGLSIEEANLRNLKGAFVTSIIRNKKQIVPVGPDEVLEANDILLFAGDTNSIMKLLGNGNGLELNKQDDFLLENTTDLKEAVVSQNSGLDHRTVKQIGFREKYDAAIVGIHRKGEKLNGKIGSLELKTGDLLLLATGTEFHERNRRNEDLIVINKVARKKELQPITKYGFWLGTVLCVGLAAAGVMSLFESLLLLLLLQTLMGFVNLGSIKRNFSIDLLIILLASLSFGKALISTGAATYLTDLVFGGASTWPTFSILVGVFFVTFVLTSLITNVAAISIIFPIVLSLSVSAAVEPKLLFLTAAFGASCCFATPFAYQTNLMVQELGNYRFKDYLKLGLPVSLLYAIVYLSYCTIAFNL